MLNHLQNEFNKTTTQNGAFAHKSTQSALLDLFSMGGAFRQRSEKDVEQLFSKAFGENPTLALKTLFYLRDITEGQGERRFFRLSIKNLALHNKESLVKNLHLVSEFGRWDDLLVLLDTSVKNNVVALVKKQLAEDIVAENPSLMGKWLPSENTSSLETKKNAKVLREGLGLTPRQYRKTLSSLRAKIKIVETNLSKKDYESIDYSKLPSRAGLLYRGAFFRNDEVNYKAFLDKLTSGEVTVNAKALYPYDIVRKAFDGYNGRNMWSYGGGGGTLTAEGIQLLDAQWKALPDFIGEKSENSIAVVDTSGSMYGDPINVAVSLGIYLAERNNGAFHNHFLTFSNKPELQKIVGNNIVEKARNLSDAEWGGSTNIEAVFRKLLKVAVDNNVPSSEMVKKVYIISDMQFDGCTRGADAHIFKTVGASFEEAGYELPNLVFWNVNAFQSNTQFTMNEQGVQLVSGFSPSIFKQLLDANGKTPYELMLDVIDSDRYKEVTA
jgi:hypothetical protein